MAGPVQNLTAWLRTARAIPLRQIDQQDLPIRGNGYGDISVVGNWLRQQAMDEGSYFVTTNPTPGTGLAYGSAGTQVSFSDTVPFIQVINTGNPSDPSAKTIWLDYLKLVQFGGTAPATTTSVQLAAKVDNGFRAATAGTPVVHTPVVPNMNLANIAPVGRVIVHTGAVATIPAASGAARVVSRCQLKGGPTLLLDEHQVQFGALDAISGGGYLTTVAAYASRSGPVGVGPGQSLTIHLWFPAGATNPFTYEYELGHFER
jgi:hypothetical protein